jgi:hypothetical protein
MAAFRLDLIGRYLRPHRRTVVVGALTLVVVNILSVTIPLEVRRVFHCAAGHKYGNRTADFTPIGVWGWAAG